MGFQTLSLPVFQAIMPNVRLLGLDIGDHGCLRVGCSVMSGFEALNTTGRCVPVDQILTFITTFRSNAIIANITNRFGLLCFASNKSNDVDDIRLRAYRPNDNYPQSGTTEPI